MKELGNKNFFDIITKRQKKIIRDIEKYIKSVKRANTRDVKNTPKELYEAYALMVESMKKMQEISNNIIK